MVNFNPQQTLKNIMDNKFNCIRQVYDAYKRYTITSQYGIINISILNNLPIVAQLSDFYINEEYRGKGYGGELFNYALNIIQKELHCESVTLYCKKDNGIMHYYHDVHNFDFVYCDEDDYILMYKKFPIKILRD